MVTTYHNHYPTRPNSLNSTSQRSLLDRLLTLLPTELVIYLQRLLSRLSYNQNSSNPTRLGSSWSQMQRNWVRRIFNLPHAFIALWIVVLFWGERWVFQSSIESCRWEEWERWPQDATPHRTVLLADPQLVDPHTYPGRPWPLSTLTVKHTDNYLRRSYISLQQRLHPDTLFFLGDLFDGGREWKTAHGNMEDPAWANGQRPSGEQAYLKTWGKRYGEDFWLKEYDRFGRIFFEFWNAAGFESGPWQRGRRIISSLPGNHDLGFGANVKIPIRNRFEVYFGEGNRVDVIGNHTFVSIDSVSLSAGSASQATKEIIAPVESFLSNVQSTKRKAVARELSFLAGKSEVLQHAHKVEDLSVANFKRLPSLDPGKDTEQSDLPTILLTHVPLYRAPGTPCGPEREHWPPTTPPKGQTTPVFPDDRNAISISRGWQYQNVLSEEDSVSLVNKIGNVRHVFSGDDHDYCEVVHESKGGVREITVKSMSWAMGVRKPGFLMLSLWNPIDTDGKSVLVSKDPLSTMQTHLCLLPDQIGILLRYGLLIGITIFSLFVRAIFVPKLNLVSFASSSSRHVHQDSLLPTKRDSYPPPSSFHTRSNESSTSSTSSNNATNLASRNTANRGRGGSPPSSATPSNGYGLPSHQARATPPLVSHAGYYPPSSGGQYAPDDEYSGKKNDDYDYRYGHRTLADVDEDKRRREGRLPEPGIKRILRETWWSVYRTAWVVLSVYVYLWLHG